MASKYDIQLMDSTQAKEVLVLPKGLNARTVPVKEVRGGKIAVVGDDMVLRLGGEKNNFPIRTEEALDSVLSLAHVPSRLFTESPAKLMAQLIDHQLGRYDNLVVLADDEGLRKVQLPNKTGPAFEPARVVDQIGNLYPDAGYQQVRIDPNLTADMLVITHNEPQKIEKYLTPGTHKLLGRDTDPFRAGVHVRFSATGLDMPQIQPYLVRLICTNGAIHTEFITEWGGRGFGEGDEMWQWFRSGMEKAVGSVENIMHGYAEMVGQALPEGERRMLAVEGMIKEAGLPRPLANAVRDQAIAAPPRTMYDLWNIFTQVATHHVEDPGEQVRRMARAGSLAHVQHREYCPTCHRN